jgi:hypothetical protein
VLRVVKFVVDGTDSFVVGLEYDQAQAAGKEHEGNQFYFIIQSAFIIHSSL